MNKITTYQDLLIEKRQLEAQLANSRALITADVKALREELKPIGNLLSSMGGNPEKSSHPLLSIGVDLLGNALIKTIFPNRVSWISKAVLPILAKSLSGIFNRNGTSVIGQWIDRFRHRSAKVRVIENE